MFQTQLEHRVNFTIVDDDINNLVVQRISVYVLDENDTPPELEGLPYEIQVPETTPVGTLLGDFTLFDADLVNNGLNITCEEANLASDVSELFRKILNGFD
jgi:hypothetical protein